MAMGYMNQRPAWRVGQGMGKMNKPAAKPTPAPEPVKQEPVAQEEPALETEVFGGLGIIWVIIFIFILFWLFFIPFWRTWEQEAE